MKKLIMVILVITIGAGLYAQNFFSAKAGAVLTYAENDARGNAQGYSILTIKDVKGSGGNMTITYGVKALDKNRKPQKDLPNELTYQVTVKDNIVIMDKNSMVPAQMKGQSGVKIDVTGTPMELPSTLQPGQALKTSNLNIIMDLGIVKTTTAVKIEGKCLAIEDVRVPAGTFKCHKITQKVTTSTYNLTTVDTLVSWYAPNIGTIKTEKYDEDNKLVSGSVLIELKGN